MKKLLLVVMSIMMMGLSLVGCGSDKGGSGSGLSGAVSTNGSTSMEKVIGILSEKFMEDNKGVTITYDASGSGTGIEAVSKGSTDIGLSSRSLKDAEKAKGLKETTVALDGIAIIVNEKNPISDMKTEDVAALFSGTADWTKVGGTGAQVAAIGREAGSGTRDGFESITNTKDKCKLTQELTSTGAVIEAVKNSEAAIGYASFASVENQKGIKVIKINGVDCTEENIANGSYVIQRPFNLITKEGAQLSEAAQAFFDYMTSKAAAELILQAGAVPTAK